MALSNKLQELVDRISRQREKFLESVSGLTEAQLAHKAEGSAWSIADVINHVSLTDVANAKLTSNFLKSARSRSLPADPSPSASVLNSMDHIFPQMNAGKFKAPEFVTPQANASVEEAMARLKVSRERMLANVEQLDGFDLTGLTFAHPFAGDLNAYQWILVAGAHEARHASQINRMKSELGFPQ
jgi:hypothetical protein